MLKWREITLNHYDYLKKIEELYDKRIDSSSDGVKAAGQWGSHKFVEPICDEIIKKIDLKNNHVVLELGCGSGILGNEIIPKCEKYVGIDLSFKMMRFFKNGINIKNIDLIRATIDKIPFQNNIFDLIIMNGVTMYIPNNSFLIQLIDEIKRVSKKNTTIFIGENITPEGLKWEFTWFQNLSSFLKQFAKHYISLRVWLMKKNKSLSGKWKNIYNTIHPEFLNEQFGSNYEIIQSSAAACTIKQNILGRKYRGNKRVDFVIKLKSEV